MVIVVIIDGKVTEIFCMADGFCKFFEFRTETFRRIPGARQPGAP